MEYPLIICRVLLEAAVSIGLGGWVGPAAIWKDRFLSLKITEQLEAGMACMHARAEIPMRFLTSLSQARG